MPAKVISLLGESGIAHKLYRHIFTKMRGLLRQCSAASAAEHFCCPDAGQTMALWQRAKADSCLASPPMVCGKGWAGGWGVKRLFACKQGLTRCDKADIISSNKQNARAPQGAHTG